MIVVKDNPSSPFLRLKYGDGKQGGGQFPDKYAGVYTSPREADNARLEFVLETWDVAEEHMSKRVKLA